MIYNSISYERSRKKNDEIITAKVDISVEENDEPHNVMEQAQAFIDSQLGFKADEIEEKLQTLKRQCRDMETEKRNIERSLDFARKQWEKAKEFLAKHNISFDDDIPF